MRTIKKLSLVVCLLLIGGTTAFAQKFGVVNSQELVAVMPERAAAMANYETYSKELSETYELMNVEFNTKRQELQNASATMTATMKQVKESELIDLQAKIEQFGYTAQQQLDAKGAELMEPVVAKAQEAIDKVAAANGYTMVFDVSAGSVAYFNESTVTNILSLVKTELGIKE